MTKRQPMQPIVFDPKGVVRFKENKIVRYMLDLCTDRKLCDLNTLALIPFPEEDWEQLMQLIGYSVSGYGDLSFVGRPSVWRADRKAAALLKARDGKKDI